MASKTGGEPAREPSADVRGGRGVIVGDNGTMINVFHDGHLADPATLVDLNPRTAAATLAAMPHDRALALVARTPDDAAGRILRALSRIDEERTIALLVDLSHERAKILISLARLTYLADLPDAAEAMSQYQDLLPKFFGVHRPRIRRCGPSPRGGRGFRQRFDQGEIWWSRRTGAHHTSSDIAAYHYDLADVEGRLGFPHGLPQRTPMSPFKTPGARQRFEGSPADPYGAVVYSSEAHGTHATSGGIADYHEDSGGCEGPLGFPTTEMAEVGPSRSGGGDSGRSQRFEGGVVYHTDRIGALHVPPEIAEYHDKAGGVAGLLGFPRAPALAAAESPYGTTGLFQRFEGPWDFPEDLLDRLGMPHGGGATIYWSDPFGAHAVRSGIGICFERLGGTVSPLGFPISHEADVEGPDGQQGRVQLFEGGMIVWNGEHDAFAVSGRVLDAILRGAPPMMAMFVLLGLFDAIGFPITEEQPLADGRHRVQIFQNCVVTIRDDQGEVWIRPAAPPPDTDE